MLEAIEMNKNKLYERAFANIDIEEINDFFGTIEKLQGIF